MGFQSVAHEAQDFLSSSRGVFGGQSYTNAAVGHYAPLQPEQLHCHVFSVGDVHNLFVHFKKCSSLQRKYFIKSTKSVQLQRD